MTPNPRVLIYHQIQAARSPKRVLTPAERIRLDEFLDTLDIPRR